MSVRSSAAALCAAAVIPLSAQAADASELAAMRYQIDALKADYEARLGALETRLRALQQQVAARPPGSAATAAPAAIDAASTAAAAAPAAPTAPAPAREPPLSAAAAGGGTASASAFNPAVSLILNGTYANLSRDPALYKLQGFIPSGDDGGRGQRSFSLGESELTLAASIDPTFSGRLTVSITADERVSVEEALFERQGPFDGASLKVGRFLSAIGYLNSQHAHAWDFVDAPFAYQAFLGGQLRTDGIQLKWVAPTERFVELGAELGAGARFPAATRNSQRRRLDGAVRPRRRRHRRERELARRPVVPAPRAPPTATYDDIERRRRRRSTNAFSGRSRTWIADAHLQVGAAAATPRRRTSSCRASTSGGAKAARSRTT